MPDIIVQSSMLSSVLPKKNPTATGMACPATRPVPSPPVPTATASRCGVSQKQEKPPRFQGAFSDEYQGLSIVVMQSHFAFPDVVVTCDELSYPSHNGPHVLLARNGRCLVVIDAYCNHAVFENSRKTDAN